MTVSSQKLAQALIASLVAGEQASKLATNFQNYLTKNHLIGLLPNIVSHLDKEVHALATKSEASIDVSHDISASTQKLIEKLVGKDAHDTSVVRVDSSLIGGFRATYRGRLFDGSVKHYLQTLRAALLN